MKQLDFAIRQYQETSPDRSRFDDDSFSRLAVWYEEDVAPVLDEYSRRPRFRRYASWPITELQAGAKTELRRLIEQVDRSLVDCAQAILETIELDEILTALQNEFPPLDQVTSGTFSTDGTSDTATDETSLWDPIEDHLRQLKRFALRPWDDLVNVQDYFGTQPKVSSVENGIAICWADAIVSLNPRLLPIGNFIVRSMWERIRPSRKLFSESKDFFLTIGHKLGKPLWAKVEDAHRQYETDYDAIRYALENFQNKHLTDACIALTQLYVAMNGNADVGWLGLDSQNVERGASEINARMRSLRGPEIHDRIATHLTSLQNLYVLEGSSEAEFERLIASRSLVVNCNERLVYWKADSITVSRKQFEFLRLVAERVTTKRTVIGNDLDAAESTSDSALASMVDRLRKRLPQELARTIKHNGEGYYLDLRDNDVVVLASQKTSTAQT
ncbi:hypothetical protein [Thalassoglobus polymorphus]|uniref:OmpR/PhoB-type domain-containing protein n=1 Tax=Thalassoglobus polymorphus TaxID=2527994 RepID=A0A517QK42_9PLAN|nr:hypothetical protein [Thalassoglobus polymorphus]QDT32011.1 hypothetical protein Mal48_12500 [Thalassoglobus polymorphus]